MRLSTLFTTLLASTALAGPVALRPKQESSSLWQPQVGAKWQIILSKVLDLSRSVEPSDATIWDIDLFNTPKSTIQTLKDQGKKVICYYSAGTTESWRDDTKSLPQDVLGVTLPEWPNEKWLDIRRDEVLQVMKSRIQLAADKGCDAVDPDNIDVYDNQNGGGFPSPVTAPDSVAYLRKQADYAASLGLSIGLKNSQAILPNVSSFIQFAVNEECVTFGGCDSYNPLVASGKPVFQIEYGNPSDLTKWCQNGASFSTVIMQEKEINGDSYYCDGSHSVTAVTDAPDRGRRHTL